MSRTWTYVIIAVVVIAIVLVLLSVALRVGSARLLGAALRPPPSPPKSLPTVGETIPPRERPEASIAAEQIEGLVRSRMAQEPGLANRRIDFTTGPDGGLEIWLDDASYASVDEIPDPRIRAIVAEAVASYNR